MHAHAHNSFRRRRSSFGVQQADFLPRTRTLGLALCRSSPKAYSIGSRCLPDRVPRPTTPITAATTRSRHAVANHRIKGNALDQRRVCSSPAMLQLARCRLRCCRHASQTGSAAVGVLPARVLQVPLGNVRNVLMFHGPGLCGLGRPAGRRCVTMQRMWGFVAGGSSSTPPHALRCAHRSRAVASPKSACTSGTGADQP